MEATSPGLLARSAARLQDTLRPILVSKRQVLCIMSSVVILTTIGTIAATLLTSSEANAITTTAATTAATTATTTATGI